MSNKKLVYVAGKYKSLSRPQHIAQQTLITQFAQHILLSGFIPVAPTLLTNDWELSPIFKSKLESYWIDNYCLPLLERCDALFVCSGKDDSNGVKQEIKFAIDNKIPVFYNLPQLLDYYKVVTTDNLIQFPHT